MQKSWWRFVKSLNSDRFVHKTTRKNLFKYFFFEWSLDLRGYTNLVSSQIKLESSNRQIFSALSYKVLDLISFFSQSAFFIQSLYKSKVVS